MPSTVDSPTQRTTSPPEQLEVIMKREVNFAENHASARKIIVKTQDDLAQVVSVKTLVAFHVCNKVHQSR